MNMLRCFAAVSLALALLVTGGCKKTMEGQTTRYKEVKDRLDALGAKNPTLKLSIVQKMDEFDKEYQAATAKGGEDGIKAVAGLVERMEKFEKSLAPAAPPATPPATVPGGKLGGTPAPPATVAPPAPVAPPATVPGGKLGGTVPPAPIAPPPAVVAPPPPAPGGKLGGTIQPAPAPVPSRAPAPAPAPAGGSFGGQ